MAANEEKPVTFGATIDNGTNTQPTLRSPPSNDTTMSASSDAAAKEAAVDASNPYSAFYKHPDARRSMDNSAPASKVHLDVNVNGHDAEASTPLSAATTQNPKVSVDGRVKECTMWPSRQAMLERKKQNRRARACGLFRNLNSKQKLWAKIVIALLIVAAAVGLGVGISRAVGGGVWKAKGESYQIPNN